MIYWIWTWKTLGLPYWTLTDFIICWTWPWKILGLLDLYWFYGILDLDLKHTTTTSLDLDLFYWTLEDSYREAKQGGRYKSVKTFLNYCFLSFNVALIQSALTTPSFGNLCMMISPSTWLCFLCSSGYRMSLSHIPITHLECFLILQCN